MVHIIPLYGHIHINVYLSENSSIAYKISCLTSNNPIIPINAFFVTSIVLIHSIVFAKISQTRQTHRFLWRCPEMYYVINNLALGCRVQN